VIARSLCLRVSGAVAPSAPAVTDLSRSNANFDQNPLRVDGIAYIMPVYLSSFGIRTPIGLCIPRGSMMRVGIPAQVSRQTGYPGGRALTARKSLLKSFTFISPGVDATRIRLRSPPLQPMKMDRIRFNAIGILSNVAAICRATE
jgi:hypothetical protein